MEITSTPKYHTGWFVNVNLPTGRSSPHFDCSGTCIRENDAISRFIRLQRHENSMILQSHSDSDPNKAQVAKMAQRDYKGFGIDRYIFIIYY